MKIGKWAPKTHLQLSIITIGAAKDNKKKIFDIVICVIVDTKILISAALNILNSILYLNQSNHLSYSGQKNL